MAGIQFDVKGTTASAVLQTLRFRASELEKELAEIKRGIEQLERVAASAEGQTQDFRRGNYTVAERKIRDQLIETVPWGATAAEITEATGVSRATVYRLLNAMKNDGEVMQAENGNWLLNPYNIPKSKT